MTIKPNAEAGSSNPMRARRPKRRPPALASRILATGLSTAAALHLVTTMELRDKTAGSSAAPQQGSLPAAQEAAPASIQPQPRPTVYVVVRRLVEPPAETAGSISPQGAAPVRAAGAGRVQPAGANNPVAAAQPVRVAPRPQATTRAS